MRWSGRIFWLLAFELVDSFKLIVDRGRPPGFFNYQLSTINYRLVSPSSRLHPRMLSGIGPWEVVSSYSSATAPGLHGISRADPLFQAHKELEPELATRVCRLKHKYVPTFVLLCHVERQRDVASTQETAQPPYLEPALSERKRAERETSLGYFPIEHVFSRQK